MSKDKFLWKHKDLLAFAVHVFNFSPDEKWESIEHVLETARKSPLPYEDYEKAVTLLAIPLIRFADDTAP